MKVLHVFDNYPGGNTQNWIYNILNSMKQVNHTITANRFTKHNLYSANFKYFTNPIESILISENQQKNTVFDRIRFKLLKIILGKYEINLFRHVRKSKDYSLVHVHFGQVAVHHMHWIKKTQLPFFVSFYGCDYEYLPFQNPNLLRHYKVLFELATCIICEGENGRKILENYGCPTNKIEIIRLGIHIDKSQEIIQKVKKKDQLNLIQIANFVEKKGHIYTIKAFHKAISKYPEIRLTLIGNGSDEIKKQVQKYILNNNLSEYVQSIDEIEVTSLNTFLDMNDVFIHPSCYSFNKDCEGGAPVVLLNAQYRGLPVLSTRHCDIPEEVIHGKTGILSEEKNIDQLTDGILKFIEMNQGTYSEFSIEAQNHVKNVYNIDDTGDQLQKLYFSKLE